MGNPNVAAFEPKSTSPVDFRGGPQAFENEPLAVMYVALSLLAFQMNLYMSFRFPQMNKNSGSKYIASRSALLKNIRCCFVWIVTGFDKLSSSDPAVVQVECTFSVLLYNLHKILPS